MKDGIVITLRSHYWFERFLPRFIAKSIVRWIAGRALGCDMYIWSGGGIDYAENWARKLGLEAKIVEKGSFKPDLAFDDMETALAAVDIRVE